MVACLTHYQEVVGSSPASASNKEAYFALGDAPIGSVTQGMARNAVRPLTLRIGEKSVSLLARRGTGFIGSPKRRHPSYVIGAWWNGRHTSLRS